MSVNKLSALLSYQLPEFVREDHEIFVAFCQAYYEFLEEDDNVLAFIQRFEENQDIDLADDEFIDQFIKEMAVTFPKNVLIDKDRLLNIIKEFYIAKGSEQSFRFLFTVLYGAEIDIQYPKIFLHKSSNGKYTSNDFVYLTGDNEFKLDFATDDFAADIEGDTSGALAVIDTIVVTYFDNQKILKLDLSSYQGDFIVGEDILLTVDGVTIQETLIGIINGVTVDDGGSNYAVGENVTIQPEANRAKARIKRVDKGAIDTVTIVSAGTGYAVGDLIGAVPQVGSPGYGFLAQVQTIEGFENLYFPEVYVGAEFACELTAYPTIDPDFKTLISTYGCNVSCELTHQDTGITGVQIISGGYDYQKQTTGYVKAGSIGSGVVLTLTGEQVGKILEIEVYDSGISYSTATATVDTPPSLGVGAVLTPSIEGVFNEPNFYSNQDDWPSNYNRIQDSNLYQDFSYIIRSNISPHEWLGTIKRIAHPAGMKLFGSLLIESEFDISISLPANFDHSLSIIKKLLLDFTTVGAGFQDMEYMSDHLTLVMEGIATCNLDLTMADLDHMKFFATFEWDIGTFAENTIDDVVTACQEPMVYMENVEYTNNILDELNSYHGSYADNEVAPTYALYPDGYGGAYADTDLTTV